MGKGNEKEDKEYEQLRREYRNMEVNRKTLAEEHQNILKRQQQSLQKLRAENENLKTDVATIKARTTMKPLNQFEQSQLDTVIQEIERYNNLNDAERNDIDSMKGKISHLKDEIWHHRRKMGGSNAAVENHQNIERQVKTLESKVDQATLKLNRTLAANRTLRGEIDSLREERISFEGVYKKVEKQLQDCKEQMAQIIERSNFAYEQRDKARMEIAAIEQSNKKEQDNFDIQMEEMGRKLEEEIKAAAERRRLQHPNELDSAEDDRAKLIAEQAAKEQKLLKEKEAAAKDREERIKQFETVLKEIEEETGISDVKELITMWKENEERNFSLFKFANQQRNEAEDLKEELDLCKVQQDYIANCDTQNPEETLDYLSRNINMNAKRRNSLDSKMKEYDNLLGIMKEGVKMLVLRLDCDSNEVSDLNINETNLLYYMGLIKDEATHIIKEYSYLQDQQMIRKSKQSDATIDKNDESSKEHQPSSDLKRARQRLESRKSCLEPPKIVEYSSGDEQYSDTDGDNARPLYGDELKRRTLNRISNSQRRSEPAAPITVNLRGSKLARRRNSLMASAALSSRIKSSAK